MEAVILAAGEGTRLRPLTSTRPKPMLPVAGKPILEWNLKALTDNGFTKAYLIVGYRKEKIKNQFGKKYGKLQLEYITQKEQLGTAHAIAQVEEKIKNEFLAMNGDLLTSKEYIQGLIQEHRKNKADATLGLVRVENPEEFGVIELRKNKVVGIEEKPEKPKSNLANAGIYVFNKEIFESIRKIDKSARLEYELTDAIKLLMEEGTVYGCQPKGIWIDVGRPTDLLSANEAMMQEIELQKDAGAEIEEYVVLKGKVHVGKGALIRSGTYIEGPCYIGENCVIGPNAYLRGNTVVMEGARVGNAVEIKNSIIMAKTNICHLSYVGDSVIGERCNFGAGTIVANLRVDNEEVKVEIKKELKNSGRRKLGCLMGDDVKTGVNVSILPGRSIYPGAYVEAGSVVRNTIYTETE